MSAIVATRTLTKLEQELIRNRLMPWRPSALEALKGLGIMFFLFGVLPANLISYLSKEPIPWFVLPGVLLSMAAIGLCVHLSERRSYSKKLAEVPQKLECPHLVLEAKVGRALYFEGVSDCGPYWIGEIGGGKLLLLMGQFLFEVIARPSGTKERRRAGVSLQSLKIIVDSQTGFPLLAENWGDPIQVSNIKALEKQDMCEKVVVNNCESSYFVFFGKLETWMTDIAASNESK